MKIENLFKGASLGEEFTYQQIQQLTGVRMDEKGKQFMRTALKRLKMPYETKHGVGIQLVSPGSAMRIITHSVVKIDRTVKRADKTVRQVSQRTYKDLDPAEQRVVDLTSAQLGGIIAFTKSASQLFKKEIPKVSTI